MISLIILILVAALVYYICVAVGLPAILVVIAVLLVFLVGWGGPRYRGPRR